MRRHSSNAGVFFVTLRHVFLLENSDKKRFSFPQQTPRFFARCHYGLSDTQMLVGLSISSESVLACSPPEGNSFSLAIPRLQSTVFSENPCNFSRGIACVSRSCCSQTLRQQSSFKHVCFEIAPLLAYLSNSLFAQTNFI